MLGVFYIYESVFGEIGFWRSWSGVDGVVFEGARVRAFWEARRVGLLREEDGRREGGVSFFFIAFFSRGFY